MLSEIVFTRNNLDACLKELGKEYRRLVGKNIRAEIILVGGASILLNYGFRSSTYDMDAVIQAASAWKDAVNRVGDRLQLPNGWLNDDFVRTASFSPKLAEVSHYYKTFSNVLEIRTISAEHLVAMKLVSARQYKNDLSDIIGILAAHQKQEAPLTLDAVQKAVRDLYGNYDAVSADAWLFLERALARDDLDALYSACRQEEQNAELVLRDFDKKYPNVLKEASADEIIRRARQKKESRKTDLDR